MPAGTRRVLFAFILFFGFCARAATYKAPLLDHHAWRQADTASIARNFLNERFNILYPQVDQRGNQSTGYVETGLEVFAFAIAAIARAGGGFHTETGRLLAAACFLLSAACLRAFVRRRHGEEVALVATFLYAFGFPLLLFIEHAFMNEALLIALSLACLLATARYLETRSPLDLMAILLTSTLLATIKLPYLIVWAPVVGLFAERDGWRTAVRWELWLVGVINLGAAFAWYSHAHALAATTGLTFGLTDKLFDPAVVFSVSFPVVIVTRLIRDLFGPVVFVAVAAGIWLALARRQWCEIFAIAGCLAYLILVSTGNLVHDYYQLALMPTAAILAGPGLMAVVRGMVSRKPSWSAVNVGAVLLGVAALSTFVRLASAHGWFEYDPHAAVLCETLHETTAPGDRLVFVGDNNPMFLFCAERKGWAFSREESDLTHVNTAIAEGARLAVLYRSASRTDIRERLVSVGTVSYEDPSVEVFRFR